MSSDADCSHSLLECIGVVKSKTLVEFVEHEAATAACIIMNVHLYGVERTVAGPMAY